MKADERNGHNQGGRYVKQEEGSHYNSQEERLPKTRMLETLILSVLIAIMSSVGHSCCCGDPLLLWHMPDHPTHTHCPLSILSISHRHMLKGICFVTGERGGPFVFLSHPVTNTASHIRTRKHTQMPYRPGMGASVFKLLHYSQRLIGCACGPSVM